MNAIRTAELGAHGWLRDVHKQKIQNVLDITFRDQTNRMIRH